PFITEEIWQQLPHEGPSITIAEWPVANKQFQNNQASEEMERIVAAIKAVRNIRSEVNTPMSKKVSMMIQTNKASVTEELEKNRHYHDRFCNVESLCIAENMAIPEQAMTAVIKGAEVVLPLEGLIDFEKEVALLEKEKEKWQKEVTLVQKKLSNKGLVEKAQIGRASWREVEEW